MRAQVQAHITLHSISTIFRETSEGSLVHPDCRGSYLRSPIKRLCSGYPYFALNVSQLDQGLTSHLLHHCHSLIGDERREATNFAHYFTVLIDGPRTSSDTKVSSLVLRRSANLRHHLLYLAKLMIECQQESSESPEDHLIR